MAKIFKNLKSLFLALKVIYMSSYVTQKRGGPNLTRLFYEKNQFDLVKIDDLIFKILAITMELHCNRKNLKSQINQIFLDQTDFFS